MLSPLQSQQNLEKSHYQQDNIRFAPKSVREVFACLHGKRDSLFRTKITNKQIMAWTGLSKASVQRATRWLEEQGYFHKQYWISSPCYNDPTVYILEEEYRTQEWQSFLTSFFKNLCKFAVFTLLSMTASGEDDVPLLLKRNYGIDIELVRRVMEPPSFKSFFKENQLGMQGQVPSLAWGFIPPPIQEPDKQVQPKKREGTGVAMQSDLFTHDQLVELAKYPQDILQRAIGTLAKKTVNNPFTWVRKICEDELAKRTDNEAQPSFAPHYKRTHKRESQGTKQQGPRRSTFQPHVEGGKWIPGARIINIPNTFQTKITHVETDLEFALNYEKEIHRLYQLTQDELDQEQPKFKGISMQQRSKFDRNPLWNKLESQQRQTIWLQAHGLSCTCRTNEQAGTILLDIAEHLVHANSEAESTYNPELFEEIF